MWCLGAGVNSPEKVRSNAWQNLPSLLERMADLSDFESVKRNLRALRKKLR